MVFNAYPFLVFLPIVYLVYWALPRRGQNAFLAISSFVFYGWWDWRFLPLLWFSTAIDFAAGIGIENAATDRGRKGWLALSLTTQLGLLAVFKYLDFGIRSAAALLAALGFHADLHVLRIVLPVGISFYTFQTLSYTISVYRREVKATRDVVDFCAFVSFFPQLVAGPIERAGHMLRQYAGRRRFDSAQAADGCRQMLYGLFLKTVVGDNCARVVDAAYGDVAHASGWSLLLATYLFAFQIYGDFAGYSHIAIGCARLFGFDLMRNFAYPYFSRSPAEFWRRWHISLSTWFRDYVYVPLGGGRAGPWRRRWNVFVTFVVSGLWHGAGFNFIAWGALHGAAVAAQPRTEATKIDEPCGRGVLPKMRDVAAVVATFHLACLGWVFFRAADAAVAVSIVAKIGGDLVRFSGAAVRAAAASPHDGAPIGWIAAVVALTVTAEWLARNRPHALAVGGWPRAARWGACFAVAFAVAAIGRREQVPFIYFQF